MLLKDFLEQNFSRVAKFCLLVTTHGVFKTFDSLFPQTLKYLLSFATKQASKAFFVQKMIHDDTTSQQLHI